MPRRSAGLACVFAGIARRKLDHDREPVRCPRLGPNAPAVPLDDLAHDREPEARASVIGQAGSARAGSAIEALEDVGSSSAGSPGPSSLTVRR